MLYNATQVWSSALVPTDKVAYEIKVLHLYLLLNLALFKCFEQLILQFQFTISPTSFAEPQVQDVIYISLYYPVKSISRILTLINLTNETVQ